MKYKDFLITPVKHSPSLVEIKFDGSGKLADALTGFYTSSTAAKVQIDAYLEGRLGKRVKNAQAISEG